METTDRFANAISPSARKQGDRAARTHNVNHLAARIMLAYLDPNDDEDMRMADALLLAWRNADDPAKPLSLQTTVYIPVESQDDVKRLQRAYQRHTDRQIRTGKMTKGPRII